MFEIDLKRDGKENLYTQIYEAIRAEILADKYTPDTKMPSIRKLASRINVNAETVVKAYDLLAAENLIYKKEGSGSYIAPAGSVKANAKDQRLRILASKNFSIPKKTIDFSGPENQREFLEEYSWDLIFDKFYSDLKGKSFKKMENKENSYLNYLKEKYKGLEKQSLYYSSNKQLEEILKKIIAENKELLITAENNLTLFKSIYQNSSSNSLEEKNNNLLAQKNINLQINKSNYESVMNFLENNTIDYLLISDESLKKGVLDWSSSKLRSLLELSQMLKFKIIIVQYFELYNSNEKIKELLKSKFADKIILIQSLTSRIFTGLESGLVYLTDAQLNNSKLKNTFKEYSFSHYLNKKNLSSGDNLINNLLAYYKDKGYLEKRIKFLKKHLKNKKLLLNEAVKTHFRGVEVIESSSLFYMKLSLDENINQHDFKIFAEKNSLLLPDYNNFSCQEISDQLIISPAALNQFSIKQGVMALAKIYWRFISS